MPISGYNLCTHVHRSWYEMPDLWHNSLKQILCCKKVVWCSFENEKYHSNTLWWCVMIGLKKYAEGSLSVVFFLWFKWLKFVINTGLTHVLQWRHNERVGFSNHQGLDCLHTRLFSRRSKKSSASLAFVRGMYRRPVDSPVTGEFPAERTSNDVIMWLSQCKWCYPDELGLMVNRNLKLKCNNNKAQQNKPVCILYWLYRLLICLFFFLSAISQGATQVS